MGLTRQGKARCEAGRGAAAGQCQHLGLPSLVVVGSVWRQPHRKTNQLTAIELIYFRVQVWTIIIYPPTYTDVALYFLKMHCIFIFSLPVNGLCISTLPSPFNVPCSIWFTL